MNWQIIVREVDGGRPIGKQVVARITRPAALVRIADLRMRLEERNAVLASMQNAMVAA
jgi:hypothetical protein